MSEYPLAAQSHEARDHGVIVSMANHPQRSVQVGCGGFAVIAGPCSVEGRQMLLDTAHAVEAAGAAMLRGGAFKPRSSPYAFRGLGAEALELLAEAREQTGLPVVTELLDARQLDEVAAATDVIQVGARNMQNFPLLAALGETERPILLKRGLSATIKELLLAAEYVMAHGNPNVILCERGIRTFETATRNTLDISAVPVLRSETHLPVLVDPSHAAGRADIVIPLAAAAAAVGADGIMVEVHPDPANALSDGPQSLTPDRFAELMRAIEPIVAATGRALTRPTPLPRVVRDADAALALDGAPSLHISGREPLAAVAR